MTSTRSLKVNEKRVLELLLENKGYTFKEIAKEVDLNEVSVRRIHNRLRQDGVFTNLNIPNYALLGFRTMIVQSIKVASSSLVETGRLMRSLMQWNNCVDCYETYDGKIIVRSVWSSPDDFKHARDIFLKENGSSWFEQETVDMVPLNDKQCFINIRNIC